MRNMASIMKKVQEIQDHLEVIKTDLATMEFTATVGGGAVRATVTGDGQMAKLKLDPDTLNPGDVEMLGDMICLATNKAHQKASEEKASMKKKDTGDLPLPPGLNLPF